MLSIEDKTENDWMQKIVKTVAVKDKGIHKLYLSLIEHHKHIIKSENVCKDKVRFKNKLDKLLVNKFKKNFWTSDKVELLNNELKKSNSKRINPYKFFKKITSNE